MITEVISEINGILSLLEAEIPGSLERPANAKLERDLERTMRRYFNSLETAMPDLSEIYYRNVSFEVTEGGKGSGNWGHSGRPGEIGGSGEGGKLSERAIRARDTYKTASASVQRQAEKNEPRLADAIGGEVSGDNEAFDVVSGNNMCEVKTIVRGKNDKITMHPPSLKRKLDSIPKGGKAHTVVFDDRVGKIYYKEGLGSFRLSTMTEVRLGQLRGIIK